MARRATLTNEALAALGAEKLARLVLDEAGRNAPFKKLVTAALAGAKGPNAVAAIIDRRLAGLERSRGFIDWEKRKTFAADLRATLATITDELGQADPAAAVDRLVRFLICADGVFAASTIPRVTSRTSSTSPPTPFRTSRPRCHTRKRFASSSDSSRPSATTNMG